MSRESSPPNLPPYTSEYDAPSVAAFLAARARTSRSSSTRASTRGRPEVLYSIQQRARYGEPTSTDGRVRRPTASRPRRTSVERAEGGLGAWMPMLRPVQSSWTPGGMEETEEPAAPWAGEREERPWYPFLGDYTHERTHSPGVDNSTYRTAVMQSLRRREHQLEREQTVDPAEVTRGETPVTVGDMERLLRVRAQRLSRTHIHSRDLANPATAFARLQRALEYLSRLRTVRSREEALRLAASTGFRSAGEWMSILEESPECEDLLVDTKMLTTPPTSWLQAGTVFTGSQTTLPGAGSPSGTTSRHPHLSSSSILHSLFSMRDPDETPSSSTSTTRRNSGIYATPGLAHKWRVRVNISSVDYSTMRLTGTMHSETEPGHLCAAANVNTFLEGEIIDFNTYTLRTFSYKSTARADATNWRKLEPFLGLSDTQIVRILTSKTELQRLSQKWVFMRWKEKCFLPSGSEADPPGLTIGGFYFLALNRESGRVQGYYYDPRTPTEQELALEAGRGTGWGSWEFR